MDLTLAQKDALAELINIGYGRVAAALAEMTGYRIMLEVPQLSLLEIDEVGPRLGWMVGDDVACVSQFFSGSIAGNAMLLLDQSAALTLSQLINDVDSRRDKEPADHRETIREVGNVVLNAWLGMFGNLLKVHVAFTVPRLQLDRVAAVLRSSVVQNEQLTHALMVKTQFNLRATNLGGYLVIILGLTSLVRVLHELERWEQSVDR